ncbi:MAG: response regulator [Bacteroidetes bacterium]|nr:response regulator [Bacteroidota bacterium]
MYGLDNASREAIQKHLRTADEQYRMRNYDAAITEIEKVLTLDPRNTLARNFHEKVKLALKQGQKPAPPSVQSPVPATPEDKTNMIPVLFRDIEQLLAKKDFHRAKEKVQEIFEIDPENFYAKAYLDNIEQRQKTHVAEVANVIQSAPVDTTGGGEQLPKGSLFMYREMLKEFWFDGKISNEEAVQLQSVREMFGITLLEHNDIEREVKVQAYVEALQIAWKDGVVTENEQKVLEMMRQRYSISAEEHLSAELKIEEARRPRSSKGTILLVDGDMETLNGLIGELKRRNYEVLVTHYIDDALNVLINRTPNIIISEIFFEQQGVDGFSLFKKLEQLPHLNHIPFFFMSSFDDDKVIRAGVRLGIDHFFHKPLDMKLVIAEIEVALKSSRD